MAKSYTVKSVNSANNSMVVEFKEDSNTISLNMQLPTAGQSVADAVQALWPKFNSADPDSIASATASIDKSVALTTTLKTAQAAQIEVLSQAASDTIAAGFMSDALHAGGVAYRYPTLLTDQMNMTASVADAIRTPPDWQAKWDYAYGDSVGSDGGRLICVVPGKSGTTAPTGPAADGKVTWAAWTTPFTCQDDKGVWALREHTAAQIEQAGADGKSFILAVRIKFATLSAEVNAATTVAAASAVVWAFP